MDNEPTGWTPRRHCDSEFGSPPLLGNISAPVGRKLLRDGRGEDIRTALFVGFTCAIIGSTFGLILGVASAFRRLRPARPIRGAESVVDGRLRRFEGLDVDHLPRLQANPGPGFRAELSGGHH